MSTTAPVIALDTHAALDAALVGRTAADLAAARAAGLPVTPGVVLTAAWSCADRATVELVWRIMSLDGARHLVTRPSPVDGADTAHESLGAVTIAHDATELHTSITARRAGDATLPILVQVHVAGSWRGELFGVDPARGCRARPLVMAAATGGATWIGELDHAGRVRAVLTGGEAAGPDPQVLARVQRLAVKVTDLFGGPRDVEWAATADGRIQLLRTVVRLAPVHQLADRELVRSAA